MKICCCPVKVFLKSHWICSVCDGWRHGGSIQTTVECHVNFYFFHQHSFSHSYSFTCPKRERKDATIKLQMHLCFLTLVYLAGISRHCVSVSLFLCRSRLVSLSLSMLAVSLALAAITATSRPPAPPSGLSSPPLTDPMLSRLCRAVSPRLRAAPGLPVWVCAYVLGQRGNGRVRSGRLSALPSLGKREDRLALQLSDWRTRKTPYWGNHMPWYTTCTYTHTYLTEITTFPDMYTHRVTLSCDICVSALYHPMPNVPNYLLTH